ncbi:diguanylate cyclase (GGDEF) domain-containing protein [Klenkia soli]|uniref:Diguanylate cyclase (GGDEF) domain-containing protein n=1 Tax=Klenkia soli TaxID=1052260 RepID=A0A1H0P2N8_9ACTN|nr:diguanylate cyclase (GGDEF) domain-containing protein [Klenkia soli]
MWADTTPVRGSDDTPGSSAASGRRWDDVDLAPVTSTDGPSAAAVGVAVDELEALSRFEQDLAHAGDDAARTAAEARHLGLPELALRADLVAADVRRRQGHLAEAGATAQTVQRWATEHHAPAVRARAHYVLAAVFQELGDLAQALEHAVHSVDLLDDTTAVPVRIDHRKRLADCLGLQGDLTAQDRYADVLVLAERAGDVTRLMQILNNSAYTASLAGQLATAQAGVERLQELARVHDVPLDLATRDTIGRVLLNLGDLEEAAAALRPGLDPAALDSSPEGDAGADILLTHAEVQRARGLHDEARASLEECIRRCEAHGLTAIRTRARRERAELFAAAGAFRDAYEEHVRYTREALALQSEQREARARTLQAMYETTEARQQSRRYRELSLRDALTGLYNRRHLDDELPVLLAAADGNRPLAVGLVDLDHFKQVNDTCSHEVGDEVLRRVARVMEAVALSVANGAFAARLGGEEFLLVMPGCGTAEAMSVLEQLRHGIEHKLWTELTQGLPVTVSIGMAISPNPLPLTPADLLGRADARLYEAKRSGRNRVVGPAGIPAPRSAG